MLVTRYLIYPRGNDIFFTTLLLVRPGILAGATSAVLSNCGLEVNSSKVWVVVRVARISWVAGAVAGIGIEVFGGAVFGTKTTITASGSYSRAIILSGSIFSGAGLAFSIVVLSLLKGTNGRLEGCAAGCSISSSCSPQGMITILIL